jgi:type IV pilus assembly protein PilC
MTTMDLSKYSAKNNINVQEKTDSSVSESISRILNTEIKLFEKKFGQKQKEWFYTETGLLLSAGVDIKTTFDMIEDETKEKKHKLMVSEIKNNIISGNTISEALRNHKTIFSNYEWQSVKIGEETGKLPEVLNELGKFYNSSIKLKRQIVGTLTYPVIVITLAIFIVYFMLSFVVPMFADIFKQTGGQLPATTQLLIRISNKSSVIFYSLLFTTGVIALLHKTQCKKKWYRSGTSNFFLKIPVIGKLIQKIYLARFCQSMRLLLGAKVLLIDALNLVKNMIDYYPIEFALDNVQKDILAGQSLNESLSKHTIFPQKLTSLIKVSEEVNAPELIFEKLSTQYSEEIEHQQAVVGKLIEPFFIIVLGFIIGFILIAMYMPLFQLSNGF